MSSVFDYLCDVDIMHILYQRFTNTGCQVAAATKFCTVATNIYGSSVWNLLHVDLLASRILKNLLHFLKICALMFFIPTCFGCTILPVGLPRRFSHTKMPNEIQNVHSRYRPIMSHKSCTHQVIPRCHNKTGTLYTVLTLRLSRRCYGPHTDSE